jgi:hypothetical protein
VNKSRLGCGAIGNNTMSKMAEGAAGPVTASCPAILDADIPTLRAALDPVELGKQIGALAPSQWPWGAPQEVDVNVVKWLRAARCIFKISLRTQSGTHRLIGKVYAQDRRDVYQRMEGIRAAGFGPDSEFSIPRPVAYLPSLRLLLQEKVVGLAAKKIFRFGDEGLRAVAAQRCARWLARFHALAPPVGLVLEVEEVLRQSERMSRLIREEGGPWAAKAGQLLEGLRAARPTPGSTRLRAGHGDYGYHQIIFAEARTAVFDWDVYDVADPARDVARFVVSLARQGLRQIGSVGALDGAAEEFVKTYLASGHPQVAAHLPFYKAALCLRGARMDVKSKAPGWQQGAEAMLDLGLRTLGAVKEERTCPNR